MVGLEQQSAPIQLINEVPSHVVLVNDKVGAAENAEMVTVENYIDVGGILGILGSLC